MSDDRGNDMDEGEKNQEEMVGRLRSFVEQMRAKLATMDDETVLSEEHIALKRLIETLLPQTEMAIFTSEFFVEEMTDDMQAGWETALVQAQHLNDISDDEGYQVFIDLARNMLQVLEDWRTQPMFALKEDMSTPEARKMLTRIRALITQLDGIMTMVKFLPKMQGGEQYQQYAERQLLELSSRQEHMIKMETAIVTGLQERGERVPKWRRQTKGTE